MPRYDFECQRCHNANQVFLPLKMYREKMMEYCPICDKVTMQQLVILHPPAVEDWGRDGKGRYFDELGPKGMSFPDKRSYKEYLKKEGLREWSPKTGMPGSGV